MRPIRMETGRLKCNSYLLMNQANDEAVLIDCGGNGEEVLLTALQNGVRISAVLLTHGHADHIEGVERIVKEFSCPVYLHSFDREYPSRPELNLSASIYMNPLKYSFETVSIADEDLIEAAGFEFQVIHTPGHTAGSVCYRIGNVLFTGDTLFLDSVGGEFPPFGDLCTEIESIRTRLYTLGEDLICYPGHGESTSLFYEMKNNMYCRV